MAVTAPGPLTVGNGSAWVYTYKPKPKGFKLLTGPITGSGNVLNFGSIDTLGLSSHDKTMVVGSIDGAGWLWSFTKVRSATRFELEKGMEMGSQSIPTHRSLSDRSFDTPASISRWCSIRSSVAGAYACTQDSSS